MARAQAISDAATIDPFSEDKPEFALLARKCLFSEGRLLSARALDASQRYASPGPDRLYSIAESFSVQTHSTCTEMTASGADLPFQWSPGKGGNPAHSGGRESMLGGRSIASAK